MRSSQFLLVGVFLGFCAVPSQADGKKPADKAVVPHVVFVVGEDEYQSEQTMPALAKEMEERYDVRCTVLLSQPDPRNVKNIPGLEALEKADAAVFFLRWRELPEEQLSKIVAYVEAGKPLVAFRTSTHAFRYPKDSPFAKWNDGFGKEVLGQKWLYHYNHSSSTDVSIIAEAADHPILKGVDKKFHCRSWLYHVLPLPEQAKPLLEGKSIGPDRGQESERPVNPVAWTWEPKKGRVFYTSLGHSDDFKLGPVRRLAINGIFWVMDKPVREKKGK